MLPDGYPRKQFVRFESVAFFSDSINRSIITGRYLKRALVGHSHNGEYKLNLGDSRDISAGSGDEKLIMRVG